MGSWEARSRQFTRLKFLIPTSCAVVCFTGTVIWAETDRDRVYDVSGSSHPAPAEPGESFRGHSETPGAPGRHGGNASEPTLAERAGSLRVQLRAIAKNDGRGPLTAVQINGTLTRPDGSSRSIEDRISIAGDGKFYLSARGGRGGDGARGGDGEGGGHGTAGRDASETEAATPGGNAGPGGDAGSGSGGAHGKDGGEILIEVPAGQTSLLMRVVTDATGGVGGAAGAGNGNPGLPGDPGVGGKGYRWEVTETVMGRHGRFQQQKTKYRAPAKDGLPSTPGRRSSTRLLNGQAGQPGNVRIDVRNEDGSVASYPGVFNLELVGEPRIIDDGDGILEPGEICQVTNITVRNHGGMPTPAGKSIEITLGASAWIVPEPVALTLPRPLQPGESVTLEGTLPFKIPEFTPSPDQKRLGNEVTSPVLLHARAVEVEMDFPRFQTEIKSIQVSLPIEIVSFESLPTVLPGQTVKVALKVRNRSQRPLGSGTEFKRKIIAGLLGSDPGQNAGGNGFALADPEGRVFSFDEGFFRLISELPPGGTAAVEATVSATAGSRPYAKLTLGGQLFLSAFDSPKVTLRQTASLDIQIAEPTASGPADILLVVNRETTAEQISDWKGFASSLGLKLKVWNLSADARFDLATAATGGKILSDLRGGTIVLLDNPFDSGVDAGEIKAEQFLKRTDFLKAASQQGIRFLWVGVESGPETEAAMKSLVIPTDPGPSETFGNPAELLRARVSQGTGPGAEGDALVELVNLKVVRRHPPDPSAAHRDAAALMAELERLYPEQRNFAFCHFTEPAREGERSWVGRSSWNYGRIEVRRSVDQTESGLIALPLHAEALRDARLLARSEARLAFFLSLSFEKKLDLLFRLFSDAGSAEAELRASIGDLLVDAMLIDIVQEQAALLKTPWASGLDRAGVREKLRHMRTLGNKLGDKFVSADSAFGKLGTRLAAGIDFAANSQPVFWDYVWGIFPVRRAMMVAEVMQRVSHAWFRQLIAPSDRAQVEHELERQVRDMGIRAAKLKSPSQALRARELLLQPLKLAGIETLGTLFLQAGDRILDAASYRDVRTAQERRDQWRAQILKKLGEKSERLSCGSSLTGGW